MLVTTDICIMEIQVMKHIAYPGYLIAWEKVSFLDDFCWLHYAARLNIYYFKHLFIQYKHTFIHPSPFAEARLLVSSSLRDSNPDLPYGKPTHYQPSYDAP